jgi:hypothetical protein
MCFVRMLRDFILLTMCIRQIFDVLVLAIIVVIVPVALHAQDKNVTLNMDGSLPLRVRTPLQETSPTQRIDSLKQKLKNKFVSRKDSVKQASSFDTLSTKKIITWQPPQDSLTLPSSALDSLAKNQKLHALLSKQGVDTIRLPDATLPLGETKELAEGVDLAGKVNLPGMENPVGELPLNSLYKNVNIPYPEYSIPGDLNLPEELKVGSPSEAIEGIDKVDVTALGEKAKPIGDALQNVDELKDRANDLKKPDIGKIDELSDKVEGKLEDIGAVDELEKQAEALEKMKAVRAKWTDPQVAKEEALNKAKQSAVNHFAGHTEQLMATMQQLSNLKAKHPHAEGVLDLFAKRQRPLKGKPFIERLLPGLAFQFQQQQSFWLDLNPHIGFKISGRFITGLGWNERIAYDFDGRDWDRHSRIYGPRSYLQFKLKGSLFLKADAEVMNAPAKSRFLNLPSDLHNRTWVWSYFGGVKKDFQLSKTFKWTMQALYNIYNPGNRSPYANRFNVRLGIELPLHKKSKQEQPK